MSTRKLTPEQEREIYAKAQLRDRLSDKGLAREYRCSRRTIRRTIERLREQSDMANFWPQESETAAL